MSNQSFQRITIVIPTYNRYPFLLRLLKYFERFKVDAPVLILDSCENLDGWKAVRSQLHQNNYSHYAYKPGVHTFDKICDHLDKIQTPYVVVSGDDDFLIPHSLIDGVYFLDKNKDFSVVHGDAFLFTVASHNGQHKVDAITPYPQRNLLDESPQTRLVKHFEQHTAMFYSIHRRENFCRNMSVYRSSQIGLFFEELLLGGLSIIQGKACKMDQLYLLRQTHSLMNSATNMQGRDSFNWLTGPNFSANYERLSKYLSEEMFRYHKVPLNEARETVKQAFWAHLINRLTVKYYANYPTGIDALQARAKRAIKNNDTLKHRLWPALKFVKDRLRSRSRYHSDFMPFYKAIENME